MTSEVNSTETKRRWLKASRMRRRKLSLLDVTRERDAQYPIMRMRFTGEAYVWLLPVYDKSISTT